MLLDMLKPNYFHTAIPELPMGKYAHLVVVRETNSFPLFQTDGELNVAYVSGGWQSSQRTISRLVMFKRKQTTAERLHGRELLRLYGVTTPQTKPGKDLKFLEKNTDIERPYYCEYNSKYFCKVCPDCIAYGFAIGSSGSERSKVLSDSAFSLTPYDISHQILTLNAPYEGGIMSRSGETKSLINEQDHVLPQTFFPAVITIRDPTEATFLYVLNNVLQTRRYGAQTTRTGTVENHLIAAVFSNGEIFSNLRLTQAIYDDAELGAAQAQMGQPLELNKVLLATDRAVGRLLAVEGVPQQQQIAGGPLREAMINLTRDEQQLKAIINQSADQALLYAKQYGVLRPKVKAEDAEGGSRGRGKRANSTSEQNG